MMSVFSNEMFAAGVAAEVHAVQFISNDAIE